MFYIFVLLLLVTKSVFSIYCYRCVSTHPGCGLYDFDIRYYWSESCPAPNDKCVKIIERKGADVIVTRDCLSRLQGYRWNIPADHYEGCRTSAESPLLGHYVNNSIPELDIKRTHYDQTVFCFCDFDERCNGSNGMKFSWGHLLLALVTTAFISRFQQST